jgi:MazG family protein
VLLHSQISKENNEFDIEDVAKGLNDKLIHRHPHVFGNVKVSSTKEILENWDKLKAEEKQHRKSVMDGVSKSQSALMSAQKISSKAVKVGFEWENDEQLMDCIKSEFQEFALAKTEDEKEEEFGDILFAVVNLARRNKIDAEQSLIRSNNKFMKRFRQMELMADKPLTDLSFLEWDSLWKKAKEIVYSEEKVSDINA